MSTHNVVPRGSIPKEFLSPMHRLAAVLALTPLVLLGSCLDKMPTGPESEVVGVSSRPMFAVIDGGAAFGAMVGDLTLRVVPDLPDRAGRGALVVALEQLRSTVDTADAEQVRAAVTATRTSIAGYSTGLSDSGVLAELDNISLSLDLIERALPPVIKP